MIFLIGLVLSKLKNRLEKFEDSKCGIFCLPPRVKVTTSKPFSEKSLQLSQKNLSAPPLTS